MSAKSYISKEKLPLGQNYKELRALGMEFIQKHSGTKWTNLNPSDPGVTFLDELCYAITELGYCADFPMEDLLTNSDNELALDQQFYLPENILTTSPITLKDYRKYVIDRVNLVENVDFQKIISNGKVSYLGYLKISDSIASKQYKAICRDVKGVLDRCRNLGVQIETPIVLNRVTFGVTGSISLNHKDDLIPFLNGLMKTCEQYIFSSVVPVPYNEVANWERNVDTIFDGPYLENGYISDEALGTKKNALISFELVNIIRALKQVKGVNKLAFGSSADDAKSKITVADTDLIEIDWMTSILSSGLEIYANGQLILMTEEQLALDIDSNKESKPAYAAPFNSADSIAGSFRDINTYYSIQETLPDVFAVGHNAMQEHDTDTSKAQSKQLKGYLTLFDQMMANQLSQLANLSTLFSFKNVTVGAPSDLENYMHGKSKLEKLKPEFPAGYRVYAPTYFYQSLYTVPDVRPLLKGYDAFDFTNKFGSKLQLENDSWKKFKLDPYNPYMKGLMDLTTNENQNLSRRNAMLDHLLARHGESPAIIDQLIDGSSYSGSKLKDQVVFKSLLLQNYGTLSYNRARSYSVSFADVLKEPQTLPIPFRIYHEESEEFDFILVAGRINEIEKTSIDDCRNFATIEMKLSLILGLKPLYKEYLLQWYHENESGQALNEESTTLNDPTAINTDATPATKKDYPKAIAQINWLLLEKKGLLFFESAYLDIQTHRDQLDDLIFILPACATKDIIPNFEVRLILCLTESLPIDLTYQIVYADEAEMECILEAYIPWFNMQRFDVRKAFDKKRFREKSMSLYNIMKAFKSE